MTSYVLIVLFASYKSIAKGWKNWLINDVEEGAAVDALQDVALLFHPGYG